MESTAIITYGSLLDPDELDSEYEDVEYVKIRLSGYCRHFSQRGTYRRGEDGENCVATVSESEDEWISALLITGLTEDEYDAYTEREAGYKIETVNPAQVSFYDDVWALHKFDEILLPVGKLPVQDTRPVPSYVKACVEGAFKHGNKFGTDFVLTTRLEP